MASGKRGHSEQCTTMESQCIASLIFHFYDDISIALLCSARRKTIISNWVSIMYFWASCVSERIYVRWEKFLISAGKRWKTKQKNPSNNWFNSNYYFLLPLYCSTELLERESYEQNCLFRYKLIKRKSFSLKMKFKLCDSTDSFISARLPWPDSTIEHNILFAKAVHFDTVAWQRIYLIDEVSNVSGMGCCWPHGILWLGVEGSLV